MATLTLTITTTEAQDAALEWAFAQRNAERVARGTKPYPDVAAILSDVVQTAIEDAVPACQAHRKACISAALDQATPDQWAAISKMLKVDLPGGDAVAALSGVTP